MEKVYITPKMEITEFGTEDVITVSDNYDLNESQGGIQQGNDVEDP